MTKLNWLSTLRELTSSQSQVLNKYHQIRILKVVKELRLKRKREVLCPIVQVQSWMKCLRWSYCLLMLRAQGSWTFPNLTARGAKIVVKRPKVSNFPMDPTLWSIIDNPDPGKRYRHHQD